MGKRRRKRQFRPYIMRGAPQPTEARSTVLDPPDQRVTPVPVRPLPIKELQRSITREAATDPRLRAVDRYFERWASTPTESGGPGLAAVIWIHRAGGGNSCAPPLDDVESKIIDAVVRISPSWARTFVHLWYRSGHTVTEIAEMLKMKQRQSVYAERQIVLSYYFGRLTEAATQLELRA